MTNETMSPLRRRMIEDMTIRNFGPKTHHDYIRSVRNLTCFSAARLTRPATKMCVAFSFGSPQRASLRPA